MISIQKASWLLAAGITISISLYSQDNQQWYLNEVTADTPGISAYRAYNELLQGKKATPVVVAVIDSGTETFHPDLKANIWVNSDEIPGNGMDDDKNGYADDVHGWSFIGGSKGDVEYDNLEVTRIYKGLRNEFYGKDKSQFPKDRWEAYDRYQRMHSEYNSRLDQAKEEKAQFDNVLQFQKMAETTMRQVLGKETFTLEDVKAYEPTDDYTRAVKEFMELSLTEDLNGQFADWEEHISSQFNYSYNLEFDPRHLVGDDYANVNERNYGNNHVDGPHAGHGTHVAGIIGAINGNEGVDGIARNVQLMIIRCVPNGDERDKDVANAIRYATDNGARIINMSFGKSYSPDKKTVDEAVRYAESKGVLMIHAAGNDARNNDKSTNFPTDRMPEKRMVTTWMEIGATSPYLADLAAPFTNYGRKTVDVFAPGMEIYSTYTGDSYKMENGTSMAAPVVSGVAAVLMSYYPELTGAEVKQILMDSSVKFKKKKTTLPGTEAQPGDEKSKPKMVAFGKLSRTGGVVNLYEAIKMAEQRK
ncbi:MAG: S8 family peptidase [Flavobacteriales bacterium]|nr:S8 family peptidase [Flavobacteriales bacterium]